MSDLVTTKFVGFLTHRLLYQTFMTRAAQLPITVIPCPQVLYVLSFLAILDTELKLQLPQTVHICCLKRNIKIEFFIHFYVPFKSISAQMRWANVAKNTSDPRKNHLAHLRAEHGLFHICPLQKLDFSL